MIGSKIDRFNSIISLLGTFEPKYYYGHSFKYYDLYYLLKMRINVDRTIGALFVAQIACFVMETSACDQDSREDILAEARLNYGLDHVPMTSGNLLES